MINFIRISAERMALSLRVFLSFFLFFTSTLLRSVSFLLLFLLSMGVCEFGLNDSEGEVEEEERPNKD